MPTIQSGVCSECGQNTVVLSNDNHPLCGKRRRKKLFVTKEDCACIKCFKKNKGCSRYEDIEIIYRKDEDEKPLLRRLFTV